MLFLFRNLRRTFLRDKRIGNYITYAIGEILLIVCGILIALEINTQNDRKKDRESEHAYLLGIHEDLSKDIIEMDVTLPYLRDKTSKIIRLDSLIRNQLMDDSTFQSIPMYEFFYAPRTFWPTVGTYNSMISEGGSGLITNRELLGKIKRIYEVDYVRLHKAGERIDDANDRIVWERRYQLNDSSLFTIEGVMESNITADLMHNFGLMIFYPRTLNETRERALEVRKEIELELEH